MGERWKNAKQGFKDGLRRDMRDIGKAAKAMGLSVEAVQRLGRKLVAPVDLSIPIFERRSLSEKDPFNAKKWDAVFLKTQQRLDELQKQKENDGVVRNLTFTDSAIQRDCDVSLFEIKQNESTIKVMLVDSETTEHGSVHIAMVLPDHNIPAKIFHFDSLIWTVPSEQKGIADAHALYRNLRSAQVRTGQSLYQGERTSEERAQDVGVALLATQSSPQQ